MNDQIKIESIPKIRDPFLLYENGTYYLYGTCVSLDGKNDWVKTMWGCYKNSSGNLEGHWDGPINTVPDIMEDVAGNLWAPEVHKYNGAFYMFATYRSKKTGFRGCSVFKSDNPEGPFCEISDGHITPTDTDSIDATLYVDKNGTPYIVYVDEWTSTPDGIGRMAVAELSKNLTHTVSAPTEIFRADAPLWGKDNHVTDGPFIYTLPGGKILMTWSGFDENGYCVGISSSENGITGEWKHEEEPLFTKKPPNDFDGGHGMVFRDKDGKLYFVIHSPNTPTETVNEQPFLLPIKEENNTLVLENSI